MDLQNKYIVLTGASSGIGEILMYRLLDEGAYVYAVSRSIEDKIDINHERLTTKNLDVSKLTNVDWLFNEVIKTYGRIDLFIANAGFTYYEMFDNADAKHIDALFDLNTRSVIYSAAKMRETYPNEPFGFMSTLSAVSYVFMPGYALYSASKAALHAFFESYRLELTRKNQWLYTVYPVATQTPFFEKADQERKPWPVQTPQKVVNAIIKGLKKDRQKIYPSKLFKYSYRLMPWFYKIYLKREAKAFHRIIKDKK